MAKVSVIVPVYNTSCYLEQCIDSILQQTLQDIEVIIIDDGSTDGSPEILKKYAEQDSRIQLLTQSNSGAGAARNNGYKEATGKYISFLDSDDFFEPDMLEKAYEKAEADRADIVVFESDQYYSKEDEFFFAREIVREDYIPPYNPFNYRQLTGNVFKTFLGWAWDKLFLKSFLDDNKIQFQELRSSEDLSYVFSALVLAKRISVCREILAHQRRDAEDSLSKTRENSWWCCYDAMMGLKEHLISSGKYEELKRDFADYAMTFILWNYNSLLEPSKTKLLDKLRSGWFADLELTESNSVYFQDPAERSQILELIAD